MIQVANGGGLRPRGTWSAAIFFTSCASHPQRRRSIVRDSIEVIDRVLSTTCRKVPVGVVQSRWLWTEGDGSAFDGRGWAAAANF